METLSGNAACTDVGPSFDRPVAGELSCNAGHLKLALQSI